MQRLLTSGTLVLLCLLTISVRGGGGHCHHCGCECQPQKVCRLVCEMKETTKVTYDYKCEDICLPGPSERCKTCGECECDCQCIGKRTFDWIPSCGKVKTTKKLVKYEQKVKVPTYKWVVEYLCPSCADHCQDCANGSCTSGNCSTGNCSSGSCTAR